MVMTGMAMSLPFGGLSKLGTSPSGGGPAGPSKSIACCRGRIEMDSPNMMKIKQHKWGAKRYSR